MRLTCSVEPPPPSPQTGSKELVAQLLDMSPTQVPRNAGESALADRELKVRPASTAKATVANLAAQVKARRFDRGTSDRCLNELCIAVAFMAGSTRSYG